MLFPRKTIKVGKCIGFMTADESKWIEYRSNQIEHQRKKWWSSRLSYHLNVRKIPRQPKDRKRGLVLHTCDQVWCINPKHLYLGTQSQNFQDAYDRGRMVSAKSFAGRKHSIESMTQASIKIKKYFQTKAGKKIRKQNSERMKQTHYRLGVKVPPEVTAKRLATFWKNRSEHVS